MTNCIFCEVYTNSQGIIYENEYFFARFDRFPVAPGHLEIVPKRHTASLFDLTKKEWENLQPTIPKVVKLIETTDFEKLYQKFITEALSDTSIKFCQKMLNHIGIHKKPDAYNIGINEGEAAGRTVHHLHIHIIPRFYGDVKDYVGGIRHIIPNMGNYKK